MRGEPFGQQKTGVASQPREFVNLRPWPFRVHVIGRHWADTAPVIDSSAYQQGEFVCVGEVRRRLHSGIRPHHNAGHRDSRNVFLQGEVDLVLHCSARFRTKVLHDGLLNVTIALVGGADLEQCLRSLRVVLSDAEQHAGGERNARAPGILEHSQSQCRVFIGRAIVNAALLRPQPGGGGLEHHSHGWSNRTQCLQLAPAHHAGVQMWQQAGLF